jgi:hypothetical protein
MPAPVIQIRRGALPNLPGLKAGEPAFTTDTHDFYVGVDSTTNNNKFFGSHRYWTKETASKGSGINLVESTSGTDFITLAAPASVGAAVTYYFPASQGGSNTVLTNDGSGNLSWGSGSSNATFTGITTFSDTTDSTSKDTGSVILEGGIGIEKSVNIGGNLSVTGVSTFNGVVVDNNGISVAGFSTIYSLQVTTGLNVSGKLDVDNGIDVANGGVFSGIVSFTDSTESTNYDNGAVVIDGGLGVQKDVNIGGDLNIVGNVSIAGTTVTITSSDVFIKNKDIVLGYTTSVTNTDISTDDTANHGGVAIASTEGTPLVSFIASGINTLPDTYKQMMWFKSGTLGFSTDAFAFNYGLAIGTTSMAYGTRLAVGSGITMSDTEITATNAYFTNLSATNIVGSISGTISTATYAVYAANAGISTQVKTVTASNTAANYYVTFVDSHNGSATEETVYTDDGIYYNPGTNTFTTQHATLTGDLSVSGFSTVGNLKVSNYLYDSSNSSGTDGQFLVATLTGIGWTTIAGVSAGTISTATRAQTVDTTGTTTNADYFVTFVDTLAGESGETLRVGAGLSVNPSDGSVKTKGVLSVGDPGALTSYIKAGGGSNALYLYGNGDVSFQSKAIVNEIRSSSNASTLITLSDLDATFARDVRVTGIATASQFSGNLTGVAVTATSLVKTPTINVTNIKAYDDTTSITISNSTGAVGFANSVTINGDLYVIGTTTQVETTELKVQDNLIDLGLIQSGGSLVPPTSDLNIDIGMLMNWYDSSAKKAAVYWDDSAGRIGIASDVTELTGVLTANAYAAVEIGSLWVTDCAGTSQVISCTGAERFLNNITVDAGTF